MYQSISKYIDDDVSTGSAAFSFYAIFSIIPLLLLISFSAGFVFTQDNIRGQLQVFATDIFGAMAGTFVDTVISSLYNSENSVWFIVIALSFAVYGSWFMFDHIRKTFFRIFNISISSEGIIDRTIMLYGVSFLYMIILLIFIFILTAVNIITTIAFELIRSFLPFTLHAFLYEQLNIIGIFLLLMICMTFLYHLVAFRTISWSSACIGASAFSLLFTVGSLVFSLYLSTSVSLSFYGASSILLVFLLWTYYLGIILFYGAELAYVFHRYRDIEIH